MCLRSYLPTVASLVLATSVLAGCSGSDEGDSVKSDAPAVVEPAAPAYEESEAFAARVLPQMADVSTTTAAAADAAWVVEATLTADKKKNAKVRLYALVENEWEVVDETKTDQSGVASLTTTESGDLHVVADQGSGELGAAVTTDDVPEVSFSDDFDTDSVHGDDPQWYTRDQGYIGVRQCSKAADEAAEVLDGVLRLSVLEDPAGGTCTISGGASAGETHPYRLNGHVGTEQTYTFTHGFAAARVKFQPGRGQHGSFWLQTPGGPSGENIRDAGTEIDVVEYFGDDHPQGGLTSFTYWFDPTGLKHTQGGWIENPDQYGDDWAEQFHVFSVEWTPEEYVFRIDGQVTHRLTGPTSAQPQFLILSLLSSDYELKHATGLPQSMDVDWVQAWETGD